VPDRSQDWLKQAARDLQMAENARNGGYHEWACFVAQQAAEKAVKALHLHFRQDMWGHAIVRLLASLPETVLIPECILENARVLDGYYIPPRYPNSHSEGAPFEYYGSRQSEEAIRYAGEIIQFARAEMAEPPDG
jgi:HEPN domain-containing protein